ncbi:MAG: hypothetical protein ACRC1D_02125 [Culicoidibacterales bacterium]
MLHNATLFTRIFDQESRKYTYKRTYLKKVSWQAGHKVRVNKGQNTTSNETIAIYVPFIQDEVYCPPNKFAQLVDKNGFFTFNAGDRIIKGLTAFELTEENTKQLAQFDDVLTISTIKVRDFGSVRLQHIELGD